MSVLNADDPEAGLVAAVCVLRRHGLAAPIALHAPWLELTYGNRTLQLAVDNGVVEPDAASRAQLREVLAGLLARLSERDALRALRERYQMLSEASFEGIVIHVDGAVVEINERLCEMVGYSRDEIAEPNHMLRVIAPEDHAITLGRIRDRIEGAFTVTLVRKDGSRFPAEFCTKQTRFGDRPMRVVALRDVTERERAAKLLRESEMRLRQMLEATFDGVVLSRNGMIVDVGGKIEQFLGVSREQLIGRSVLDFAAPSSRDDVSQRLQGQTGRYEATVLGANGELIPAEIIGVSSTLDGEPVRAAGVRDLRGSRRLEQERRRLELQAERSQRLQSLGVLAGGIAHDFNNLLVGVLGGAELLESQLVDPDQREIASMIRIAGERASSLTKQLMAYAGRRGVRATETLDVGALLTELRGLLSAALSKKALITFALEPACLVSGERATLTQVLMNLLVNASDALEDRAGTIEVRAQRVNQLDARWDEALGANLKPGEWVLLQVRDDGVGMDQATKLGIFEPFYSTKPHGHGLGLGTCLGIVAAHGGAIHVDSVPGQGSTFSVLLPAVSASVGEHPLVGTRTRPCRVLIIDDEALVRQHLRRLLELRGFSVLEASDGRSGMAAAANGKPDLMIVDLNMPELDGLTVVRRMRAAGSHVPVVLCSGNLSYEAERGMESGLVQGVLQKPFSTEEMLEAIERAQA